jgi:hypothetical protein
MPADIDLHALNTRCILHHIPFLGFSHHIVGSNCQILSLYFILHVNVVVMSVQHVVACYALCCSTHVSYLIKHAVVTEWLSSLSLTMLLHGWRLKAISSRLHSGAAANGELGEQLT